MSKESTVGSVHPKRTDAKAAMKQTQEADRFEQLLLTYVEMCYSVALALTRNPYDAQDLARAVVIAAWHLRGNAGARTNIKMKLLTALREEFLHHYGRDLRHIARGKEWNAEKSVLKVQGAG